MIPTIRMTQLLGCAAVMLVCASASTAAFAQTKLNVGYVPTSDFLPAFVAKDVGIFEKRKLDVTLTRVALAPNVPPAIIAGSLQIGMGTATLLLDTADAGLGLVAIAGTSRMTDKQPVVSIIARAGANITTAADLKGKRVGVPGFRSMMDVSFRKWLLTKGVKPAEVNIVEASFPQMRDLLKGGTLDAVAVIEPFRSRITSDQTGIKVADYLAELRPDMLAAMWLAKGDWVTANAQAVRDFRESLAEGMTFIAQNPDKAREIEKKYLGFNAPQLPPYSLAVSTADLDYFVGISRDIGIERKVTDMSSLIAQ